MTLANEIRKRLLWPFRNAVKFPVNDPFLLVLTMAMVTKHLSFGNAHATQRISKTNYD